MRMMNFSVSGTGVQKKIQVLPTACTCTLFSALQLLVALSLLTWGHSSFLLRSFTPYHEFASILILYFLTRPQERHTESYRLILVGHSLGAGTAAILAILLRPYYPDLFCYAFSPPGATLRYTVLIGIWAGWVGGEGSSYPGHTAAAILPRSVLLPWSISYIYFITWSHAKVYCSFIYSFHTAEVKLKLLVATNFQQKSKVSIIFSNRCLSMQTKNKTK